jgi:hypothetical protein
LRKFTLCLLCFVFCLLCSFPVFAEKHGQLMFAGVPIPGATVSVTQGDKTFVTITDEMGTYSFPDLTDGPWPIEIEMQGFAKLKGDTGTTTWELKMLTIEEIHAEVAHNEPTPPAEAPAGSGATPAAAANGKPAKGNSKVPPTPKGQQSGFASTQVNASANANAQPADAQPQQASSAFANASQEELNRRSADASVINGTVNNGAASPFAQLNGFGNNRRGLRPLYNGGIGVVGFDTSPLDARQFSLNGANTARPSYTNGTFAFNFGGPMKIPGITHNNGPNFFVGFQRVQTRTAGVQTGQMPTAAERTGDLSQMLTPLGQPVQIIDPTTGKPFDGNLIPNQRISPQAQSLLAYFPLPNFTGNPLYNYQIPTVTATHTDQLSTNINKAVNQRNQLFGNFAFSSTRNDNPNLFNFLDSGRTKGINTAINWTVRPTQRFSATFRYQFSRFSSTTTPFFANRLNVAGLAGITGNNQDAVNWGPPTLGFAGFAGLSDGLYSSVRNETNTVSYSSFWNHGRHNVQFGADLRRQQFNTVSQQNPRGNLTFTGAATRSATDPTTGADLADFLLGIPDTSSIAFGNADKYFRQNVTDAFFQDDWRINGALTLMLGARWEYEQPINEKYKRLVNLNIGPNFSSVSPVVGNGLVHSNALDVLPRMAFAWRPIAASSVIVRGSYGLYRNTGVYQSIANQMAQQSPLSTSLSVSNTPSNPLTLANPFTAAPGVVPNTFAIDPNFRIGYAHNWMLSVQRDLPYALQMTAIYLGTKGTRLPQEFLPNTFPTGAINPSGYVFLASNGNSYREAGQIQLRRRLRSGFTASLQYTYAKAIDDAPLMGGNQVATVTSAGTNIAQNWLNLSGERALSSFDQRHQLQVQGQYTSGSGVRGGALLSGWKGALLKEWLFASTLTVGSGSPETPVYLAAVNGTGFTGSLRPDVTGASITAAPAGKFLNPAAFAVPVSSPYGNAGRNSIIGPAQFSLNGSLGRTFPWGDRYNVDLRFDATNLLNHVTFNNWNTNISSAQFGLPQGAAGMRVIQTTMRLRF